MYSKILTRIKHRPWSFFFYFLVKNKQKKYCRFLLQYLLCCFSRIKIRTLLPLPSLKPQSGFNKPMLQSFSKKLLMKYFLKKFSWDTPNGQNKGFQWQGLTAGPNKSHLGTQGPEAALPSGVQAARQDWNAAAPSSLQKQVHSSPHSTSDASAVAHEAPSAVTSPLSNTPGPNRFLKIVLAMHSLQAYKVWTFLKCMQPVTLRILTHGRFNSQLSKVTEGEVRILLELTGPHRAGKLSPEVKQGISCATTSWVFLQTECCLISEHS